MPILVLRHEPFEHLGRFASVLSARNVPFSYRDLGQPLSLEELHGDGQDGVVIMGGPMSANDALPGLAGELSLIEQAVEARIPLLGICLGAQLIAKALGARVYRNPEEEIGWAPVYLTDAGQSDPLFRGIASPSDLFHWHGETFDMPAGARWLAYSDKCRHQAFSFGESVYGLQFHPEITPEMILDWSAQPANCADVERLDGPIDPYAADPGPLAERIFDRWLALTGVEIPGAGMTR
jgi:GMP synthase (glutamine-hydrolysing)